MKYTLVIIFLLGLYFFVRKTLKNEKKLEFYKRLGIKIIDYFIPADMSAKLSNLKQDSFDALNDESTLSNLLMYSHYVQEEEGEDKFGVYTLRTGRQGIILEISPPSLLTDEVENSIQSLLGALQDNDIVVNFFTYASPNIQEILNEYEEIHTCNIKVKNPDVLKSIVKEKVATLSQWSDESILPYADFRLRNFRNLISVVFPKDTPISKIKSSYFNIKGSLTTMNPKNFRADSFLVLLHDILKPGEKITKAEVDLYRQMNMQFAQGVSIKVFPNDPDIHIGDKMLARVLTTQKFPKKMQITDMQNALFDPLGRDASNAIPSPFIASLTIHMEHPRKISKNIEKKCRTNLKQTSKIKYNDQKSRPDIGEVRDESERTIKYIQEQGQIPYAGMYTIVVLDKNKDNLDRITSMVKKKFHDIPTIWELKEEKFSRIAFLQFIFSLPINFYQPVRKKLLSFKFDLLFKANNSYIAPIVSGYKGFGKPFLLFTDRTGQVFKIDPFESNANYNLIIVGPPGAGKSVFCNNYIGSGLGAEWKIWMFDLGDSYINLNTEIGGQSVKFKENNTICVNFFTHINTKKIKINSNKREYFGVEVMIGSQKDEDGLLEIIHEDEFETLVPMIGIMSGLDLRSTGNYEESNIAEEDKAKKKLLASLVEAALEISFLRQGRKAGMKDVRFAIGEIITKLEMQRRDYIVQLADLIYQTLTPYAQEGGKFFKYFNGAFNVNMDNAFFLLEQEELKNKGELLEVICYGFLQRIAQYSFLEENRKFPKMIGFDEAAPLLKSELFVHYLDDFSRRLRKYYGALTIITQYFADFHYNSRAASLFSGASYKIFLEHERSKIEESEAQGHLSLEDWQKELFKSLRKTRYYSEFIFIYRDIYIVGRLALSPMEISFFTTNPKDRAFREYLMKKYGINDSDSLFLFAKLNQGVSEDKALLLLAERNQHVNKKYWKQKIRYALTKKMVHPYVQGIISDNNGVFAFEVLMRIEDEAKNIISPSKFSVIAKEQNLFVKLQMELTEQTFSYFSKYPDFSFSMNISVDELLNEDFIEFLYNKLEFYAVTKQFIIEINSEDLGDNEQAIQQLINLEKSGIRLALDKVNYKNLNFSQIINLVPQILKIDSEVIKTSQNGGSQNIKKLVKTAHLMNLKTVAMHVSDEKLFKSIAEFGVDYYQGYYFSEPVPISSLISTYQIVEEEIV